MKKLTILLLLKGFIMLKGQVSNMTWIKPLKEDSTKFFTGSDTSYIFNAFVLTHTIGGISSFTLTCKIYNAQQAGWNVCKDTSYTWSAVSAGSHNNQDYAICKQNNNLLKVCLGRLDPATRKKFIFRVMGSNGILTKEFNF